MNHRSNIVRALKGSELPHDDARVYARNFEVPSGGGVATARGIAHAYSVFSTGGRELGLRPETLGPADRSCDSSERAGSTMNA